MWSVVLISSLLSDVGIGTDPQWLFCLSWTNHSCPVLRTVANIITCFSHCLPDIYAAGVVRLFSRCLFVNCRCISGRAGYSAMHLARTQEGQW